MFACDQVEGVLLGVGLTAGVQEGAGHSRFTLLEPVSAQDFFAHVTSIELGHIVAVEWVSDTTFDVFVFDDEGAGVDASFYCTVQRVAGQNITYALNPS